MEISPPAGHTYQPHFTLLYQPVYDWTSNPRTKISLNMPPLQWKFKFKF